MNVRRRRGWMSWNGKIWRTRPTRCFLQSVARNLRFKITRRKIKTLLKRCERDGGEKMGQKLQNFFEIYFKELYFPKIQVTDDHLRLLLCILVYQLMVWIKHTKTWMLLRELLFCLSLFTRGYLQDAHNSVVQRIPSASRQQQQLSCSSRSCENVGAFGQKFLVAVVPFEQKQRIRKVWW